MQIGAIIVAAGMSSRMGNFKPMLSIGSISIAQRIIATFQQAGITNIAIVTGYNANILEKHLANSGVIFLRNEDYANSHMFDSAKIALQYMRGKCDKVFFTPVDIPLFTANTVNALMQSDAEISIPTYKGEETGHPILISNTAIDKILKDSGREGLRGIINNGSLDVCTVSVDDAGILHDADTPEDYQKLLDYHNKQLIRPEISVSLAKEKVFFNRKIALLLTLIDETNSVKFACSRVNMSYSSGLKTIDLIEQQFNCKLVERNPGGTNGGKSVLTADGRSLLDKYKRFEAEVKAQSEKIYSEIFPDISDAAIR